MAESKHAAEWARMAKEDAVEEYDRITDFWQDAYSSKVPWEQMNDKDYFDGYRNYVAVMAVEMQRMATEEEVRKGQK